MADNWSTASADRAGVCCGKEQTMSKDIIYREDAIAELWDMTTEDCPNPGAAVGKCMEAIRHLPSADTFEITKEALIEAIDNAETVGDVVKNIIDRPKGEWIDCKGGWKCTNCRKENGTTTIRTSALTAEQG